MIPAKELSATTLKEYSKIMVAGNLALIECAKKLNYKNAKAFRIALFNGSLTAKQTQRLSCSISLIQEIKKIEWDILCHSIRLMRKFTGILKAATTQEDVDMQQEASLAILDALYGYTDSSIKISTYMGTAIRNHFFKVARYNGSLSRIPRKVTKIMAKVSKAKKNLGENVSMDALYQEANLEKEEIVLYEEYTVRTVSGTQLCKSEDGDDGDYSKYGRDAGKEDSEPIDAELKMAVECAELDDFERLVLKEWMEDKWGWMSRLARDHVNPATEKNYTRAGIQFILNRVIKKIKSKHTQLLHGHQHKKVA